MAELFRELADNAPVMIWRSRPDKLCDFFNKPWLDFTGRSLDEESGMGWASGIHPEDRARCLDVYGSAFDAGSSFTIEYRLRRHDGAYRWVLYNGSPFKRNDDFAGYFGSCIDITERRQLEQGRVTLISELNHRVKNMLSTVQSLARQSWDRSSNPHMAGDALQGRLMALSQAHEILAEQHWLGAELGRLTTRIARLADPGLTRIDIEGEELLLPPQLVQSLAMALHELAANALQHGSLLLPQGRVEIRWRRLQDRGTAAIELEWRERNGPPVSEPVFQGLGMRVLRTMLPREAGGETKVEFRSDGLVCQMRLPNPGAVA